LLFKQWMGTAASVMPANGETIRSH
jgi:hypothetical protein